MGRQSQEAENSPKRGQICQRKSMHLFVDMGVRFGKNLGKVGLVLWGRPFLPRRGDFFPKDDCVDCQRPREKKNKDGHDGKDGKNKKLRRCRSADLPCLGSVIVSTGRRILFPFFHNVVKGNIQRSFQAFLHDGENLCFEIGFLLFGRFPISLLFTVVFVLLAR